MIKIPAQLASYGERGDHSVRLTFYSSLEISDDEMAIIRKQYRYESDGWLLFVEDEVQEIELPKDDANPKKLSHSQRMRRALWQRQRDELGRKPTDEEASTYYKSYMEARINKILDF